MTTGTPTRTPAAPATPTAPASAPASFFSAMEARIDQWRELTAVTRGWASTVGRGANDDVGHDRFGDAGLEAGTRLGIELADFGQHVEKIFLIDAAELF